MPFEIACHIGGPIERDQTKSNRMKSRRAAHQRFSAGENWWRLAGGQFSDNNCSGMG